VLLKFFMIWQHGIIMSLTIKPNKKTIKGKCAMCGKSLEVKTAYALFMPDTVSPVCDECALKDDPKLLALLKLVCE